MAVEKKDFVWTSTAYDFYMGREKIKCLIGPMFSGKSYSMTHICMFLAELQEMRNGEKHLRILITRSDYPRLIDSVVKDLEDMIPAAAWIKPITKQAPMKGSFAFRGSECRCIVELSFLTVEDFYRDEMKLKSKEYDVIYVSEAQEIRDGMIVETLAKRVRQDKRGLDFPYYHVMMDANYPSEGLDHWLYDMFHSGKEDMYKMYKQPSALNFIEDPTKPTHEFKGKVGYWEVNPDADYLNYIPGGAQYHWDIVNGQSTDQMIMREVVGDFDSIQDGDAVYDKFKIDHHVSKTALQFDPDRRFIVGVDLETHPALVITQTDMNGHIRVYDSLYDGRTFFHNFFNEVFMPLYNEKYHMVPKENFMFVLDPSERMDGNSGTYPHDTIEKLQGHDHKSGFKWKLALTNREQPRLDCVNAALIPIDGFKIDPGCKSLIKAMAGSYRYEKKRGSDQLRPSPEKDEFSHEPDALAYAVLEHTGGFGETKKRPRKDFKYV